MLNYQRVICSRLMARHDPTTKASKAPQQWHGCREPRWRSIEVTQALLQALAKQVRLHLTCDTNGSVFGKRCVVCNRNSIQNSKLVEILLNMTRCMISHLLLYISLHSPNFIRKALKPRPSLIHRPSQHSSAEAKSSVGDTIRQSCSLGQQVNPALNSLWLRPWLGRWRKNMVTSRRRLGME